jgi:D-cysteine desulfhydrase
MHAANTQKARTAIPGNLEGEDLIAIAHFDLYTNHIPYILHLREDDYGWTMQLARFARRRYMQAATPIEPLRGLSRHLGGPDIWIKRDDLTPLAGGGSKTRALEFLVADALAQHCDTLVTAGPLRSNHCRLTLAAAAREGLACRLILEQSSAASCDPAAGSDGFLYDLLGAEEVRIVAAATDLTGVMQGMTRDLARSDRKGYVIPRGGSSALGVLGYVVCAQELLVQALEMSVSLDHIVCAAGSGGTQAGLLVGLHGNDSHIDLTGISVRAGRLEQELIVHALTRQVTDLLDLHGVPLEAVRVLDEWIGPGHALPSEEMVAAVRLVARLDGVLLDPVYTGKAMAGLIGLIRRGCLQQGQNVLFLHTGGLSALYSCPSALQA